MDVTLGLYVGLAGIAGVFVGFGALISVSRSDHPLSDRMARIRGAVTIGLTVIVAALLPLVISRYDVDEQALWRLSSLVFLALSWTVFFLAARSRSNRQLIRAQAQQHPLVSAFFWLALELPIQVPLILAVLAVWPDLGEAFYTTALVFNLFQAAFILAQVVYAGTNDAQLSVATPAIEGTDQPPGSTKQAGDEGDGADTRI